MTIFSYLLLSLSLLGSEAPDLLDAGSPDIVTERLSTAFDDLEAENLSGYVAVTHHGEIIFEQGFGAANPADGTPFTRDTHIDMASIVKTYTGMMAAQLIADGRLTPAQRLSDFFPMAPSDKAGITLHQLLTHSSGLPEAVANDGDQISPAELLDRVFAAPLSFEPGSQYAYSNVGFSIVALIIEQVTGQTYEDYLLDTFLHPAGIHHTGYVRAYGVEDTRPQVAHTEEGQVLHEWSWGGDSPGWALVGNGGMVTTIADLVAWRRAYNRGDLISPDAIAIQQSAYIREGEGAPSHYGYGVVVEDHPNFGRVYWHNGGSGPFTAHWREYADTGYGILAAANTWDVDGDAIMLAATGAIFGVELRMATTGDGDDWQDVDFDASPMARLAGDFLDVAQNGDTSRKREFVETRMFAGLQAAAPMDQHIAMMNRLAGELDGLTLSGIRIDDNEGLVIVRHAGNGDQILIVEIGYEMINGVAMMSGLRITD